MKYIATIEFDLERHCADCPLRDAHTDGCKLQKEGEQPIEFETWAEQMENCPLERVSEDL